MSGVEQSLLREENFFKLAKTGRSASAGEDSHVIFTMLRLVQSYQTLCINAKVDAIKLE